MCQVLHTIPIPYNSPQRKYYYRQEKGKLRKVKESSQHHTATMSGIRLNLGLSVTNE